MNSMTVEVPLTDLLMVYSSYVSKNPGTTYPFDVRSFGHDHVPVVPSAPVVVVRREISSTHSLHLHLLRRVTTSSQA